MTRARGVLVVGHDPTVGESVDLALAGKGYGVIAVDDGDAALQELSSSAYDVVFVDIEGAETSSLELAERVQAEQPRLAVVIVTHDGSEVPRAKASTDRGGGRRFLRKPLSAPEIEEIAKTASLEKDAKVGSLESAAPTPVEPEQGGGSTLRNIALFFAGPFVSLAYMLAFPFVGLGVLVWMGVKSLTGRKVAKTDEVLRVIE